MYNGGHFPRLGERHSTIPPVPIPLAWAPPKRVLQSSPLEREQYLSGGTLCFQLLG